VSDQPQDAATSAWFAYRAVARKQGREVDERTYRDAFRDGARFTFTATSRLAPALDSFQRWLEFVTDWPEPPSEMAG
jgi:hypothetical protein